MTRTLFSLLSLLSMVVGLAGCSGEPANEVVLYVSADRHVAEIVIDAFEEETGVRIRVVGDSEALKTAGLVERLRREKDNPQADVFWSSEVFMTIALAEEGVLAPYDSDAVGEWPAEMRDDEGRWYGFGNRARVVVYAPGRVAAEDLPATWMDLARPRWKGRIVMADPRFGTTGGHLGAMKAFWENPLVQLPPGYYQAFVEGIVDNDVTLLPSGNAGVVEAVASGQADLGMTDTDDVWAAQRNGLEVDLVYPRHHVSQTMSAGTLLIPNTVARVAGGPNEKNAALLIDFLSSERVERLLAESDSHNIPIRADLAAEFAEYAVDDPLIVDLVDAARQREDAVRALIEAVADRDDAG